MFKFPTDYSIKLDSDLIRNANVLQNKILMKSQVIHGVQLKFEEDSKELNDSNDSENLKKIVEDVKAFLPNPELQPVKEET